MNLSVTLSLSLKRYVFSGMLSLDSAYESSVSVKCGIANIFSC